MIATAVNKKVQQKLAEKAAEDQTAGSDDADRAYIMSLFERKPAAATTTTTTATSVSVGATVAATAAASQPKISLSTILKRASGASNNA